MGADVIIGVDIQSGLDKKEEFRFSSKNFKSNSWFSNV